MVDQKKSPWDEHLPSYEAALTALTNWDGTTEQAEALRAQVGQLTTVPAKPPNEDIALLSKVVDSRRKGDLPKFIKMMRDGDAQVRARFAPLFGDPALAQSRPWLPGGWAGCVEQEGVDFLTLASQIPTPVGPDLWGLFKTFFRARKRNLWKPSAEAGARFALRDEGFAEFIGRVWSAVYPAGLPKKWNQGKKGKKGKLDTLPPKQLGTDQAHLARHTLYLASAYLASGGAEVTVPGLDPKTLIKASWRPLDDSDKSVLLEAALLFVGSSHETEAFIMGLTERIREIEADAMCDAALREFATRSGTSHPQLLSTIYDVLSAPRWKVDGKVPEYAAAWSWVQSAQWFEARCDTSRVESMFQVAGPLSEAMGFACQSLRRQVDVNSAMEPLCASMNGLISDAYFSTSSHHQLLGFYTTGLAILTSVPWVGALDWPSLVERAVGHRNITPLLPGTVDQVGVLNFGCLCAQRKSIGTGPLLHGLGLFRPTPGSDTKRSALSHDEKIATEDRLNLTLCAHLNDNFAANVALRIADRFVDGSTMKLGARTNDATVKNAEESIKLIWRIVRADPPARLFRELKLVLRSQFDLDAPDLYVPTPLQAVVEAAYQADEARDALTKQTSTESLDLDPVIDAVSHLVDESAKFANQPDYLRPLIEEARALKTVASDRPAESLRALKESINELLSPNSHLLEWRRWMMDVPQWCPDSDKWLKLKKQDAYNQALVKAADDLTQQRLESLNSLLDEILASLPCMTERMQDNLESACEHLRLSLDGFCWPEIYLLEGLFKQLVASGRALMHEGRQAIYVNRTLQKAFEKADEMSCQRIAKDPTQLELLTDTHKRALNGFLQRHMLFADARHVQAAINSDVRSNGEYLRPLYIGAAAGTFFVLDVGTDWLDLIKGERSANLSKYVSTLIFCFTVSLGLLSWNLGRRMQTRSLIDPIIRLLPTFGIAVLIAATVSLGVGWSTGKFEGIDYTLWSLPLWTALSLFLGVFLQLIVGDSSESG